MKYRRENRGSNGGLNSCMQITKSITARHIFKVYPEIRRQLWGGEFWSDGGYIRIVGEGITAEIIRDYI